MIDMEHEELITLAEAARRVPNRKSGRGVNCSTVWRWCLAGCKGVRLETVFCGGTRFTSREALQRFFVATTAAASGETLPSPTAKQRAKAVEAAERELTAAGI